MPTKSLPSILEQLSAKDIKQRQQGAINIIDYLKSGGVVEPELVGDVVDVLGTGITNSNVKSVFDLLVHVKPFVRDEVQEFLQPAMKILGPDVVFDKILLLFKDKNWRSREQALLCLTASITNFGIQNLPMQAILANIIKVLEDPIQAVRDAAVMSVEEISIIQSSAIHLYLQFALTTLLIYREVGEPLRTWLQQNNLRPALLGLIFDRLNTIETNAPAAPASLPAPQFAISPPLTMSRSSSSSSMLSNGSDPERNKSSSPKSMLRKLENRKSPKPDRLGSSGEITRVVPVKIISEKELNKEMEDIGATLAQVDDWEKRAKALQRLAGLTHGGAVEFPTFLPLLQRLRDPLAQQVADLRSSVAKEACTTLTALSAAMGDAFEPLADTLIEVLMKSTVVTIQIISDSANKCIRAIIKQTRINRGVLKIIEGTTNKNGVLRSRSMEYILLLLGVASTGSLEKYPYLNIESKLALTYLTYVDQLENTIKNGVSDAVGEVRAAARSSLILFQSHWEARGNRLLSAIEPHAKKLVLEEMQRDDLSGSGSYSAPERPGSSSSSKRTGPVRAAPTPPPERGSTPLSGSLGRPSSHLPKRELSHNNSAPNLFAQTKSKLPERAESATPTATTPTLSHVSRNPPAATPPPPSSIDAINGRLSGKRSSSVPPTVTVAIPPQLLPPSRITPPITVQDDESDVMSDAGYPEPSTSPDSRDLASVDINRLFQDTESTLWSSRADAFVTLQRLILNSVAPNPVVATPIASHVPRIAKLILERLADPHAKVVKSVLDCLQSLATHYSQPLVPYLDRILPPMFARLSGLKDEPRVQASMVLTALLAPLRGTVLLTSVLRVLDVLPPKPRAAALEYTVHLIPHSQEHLTYPPHMRTMVHKILIAMGVVNAAGAGTGAAGASANVALILADPAKTGPMPPELKRAGLQCLAELYNHYKPQFLAQLLPMPVNVQYEVKKLLATVQVNVDADLAAAKTAPTAPSSSMPPPAQPVNLAKRPARPPSVNSDGSDRTPLEHPDVIEYRADRTQRPKSDDYGYTVQKDAKAAQNPVPGFNNMSLTNSTSTGNTTNRLKLSNVPPPPLPPTTPVPTTTTYEYDMEVSNTLANHTNTNSQNTIPTTAQTPTSNLANATNTSTSSLASSATSKKDSATKPRKPNKPQSPLSASQTKQSPPSQKTQPDVAIALNAIENTTGDARRDGLHKLVKLIREDHSLVRGQWFEKMLVTILESLRDDVAATRELALLVLCEMTKAASHAHSGNAPSPFEPFMNITVARVMEMFRDKDNAHEVKQAAEDTLEHLLRVLDPLKCCSVLVALVQEEDGAVLQASIRFLSRVALQLSPTALRHQLATLLPGLFDAFKNSNADVRKAVVFCLVDIYNVLGDEFIPYLASLSTSQKKLVTIYINRSKNKGAESFSSIPG